MPLSKEGDPFEYILLTTTLTHTLYLGCILEQKRRRGAYRLDWYNVIEDLLRQAFQLGKEYAPIREVKSKKEGVSFS